MYRPDGWINPYLQQAENGDWVDSKVFEAGADAMLEALRTNAERFKEWEPVGKEGYLIFVPVE